MDLLDNDSLLFLVIIVLFLGFFLWNRKQTRQNRDSRKNRNFRRRYEERKKEKEKENENNRDDDTKGPSRTPFPPD